MVGFSESANLRSPRYARQRCSLFLVSLLAAGTAGAAQLTRVDIAAPGVMTSSCAGLTSGNGANAGDAVHTDFPAELVCNSSQSASVTTTITSDATYTNGAQHVQADASASARFGVVGLYADYSGPNSAHFPRAVATAGWVDQLTILPTNPGDLGANGVVTFALHVSGALDALAGFNTSAGFQLIPYENDQMVGVPSSFNVSGQGQINFPYHELVDTDVVFQLPFVFGTSFELGIFARALAGTASQGAVDLINTSTADFANTILWNGITTVTKNGVAVGYTLTSASGIDWTQAASPVPLPAAGWLLLPALGLLGRRARMRICAESA